MPQLSSTICNGWGALLGAFLVSCVIRVSYVPPLFSKSLLAAEEIWTAEDLSSMARSSNMAAAIGYLTSVSDRSRELEREYDDIKKIIDGHTAATIRTALLRVTSQESTDTLAKFARTTNAVATCSTAGTAGEHGLDACLAGCEKKNHFLTWTPRKATCYILCALATSPCTRDVAGTTIVRPVAWGTMRMGWIELSISWMTWVMDLVGMMSPMLLSLISRMANRADMMITSCYMVQVEWMTWGINWTAMKVLFLLRVAYEVCAKLRTVMGHGCKTEKSLEETRRELDELKLQQMFETRKMLLNEEGQHALHDLNAWVIDRDSVNGGQG